MAKGRTTAKASAIERSRMSLAALDAAHGSKRKRRTARKKARKRRKQHWQRLDFFMQHQQHSCWCWAAVSTSVAHFYEPDSRWTQCTVANAQLDSTKCCGARAKRACNQPSALQTALKRVGHLRRWVKRKAKFDRVEGEIDGGRPLCVRTAWQGGGAHVVAIIGYHASLDMLGVDDPLYGHSDVDYDTFCAEYRGLGTWSRSYYTR